MAFLEHKGRTVAYRLLGDSDRPLLILAHPLGMTQGVWDGLIPALLPRFRILTWDLPGHGASASWPAASTAITPDDLADEALALADIAGATTFHFAGTSIGGVVGQQLISKQPGALQSATLTNTGAVIGTEEAWRQRSTDVMAQGLAAMAGAIVPRWFGPETCRVQPALVDGWKVTMGRGDDRSYALLCEMLGRCDFRDALKDRGVPVQLIGGADDVATPPATLQALADALGASAPTILTGIGHVPSVECPDQMATLLLNVIA